MSFTAKENPSNNVANSMRSRLRIPMKYMYYSIPIGFGLMIIHAVDAILQILQEKGGALR